MIVRHWMTTRVVSTRKEASVQEAMAVMKRHSIRHLPVLDSQGRLEGWVTDADLRSVLIASMLEDLTVQDVMVRSPHTVDPDEALERAAKLILEKKIGGLPVVRDEKLVGVITVIDILSAFITMLGLMESSSRVDVKLAHGAPSLESVTRLLEKNGAEIISVCQLRQLQEAEPIYSFRFKKRELEGIVQTLTKEGIQVLSAEA
ncbi:acetoin utilization protein AcuB [Desulfacinum hydrothermale DSM 13146]|uniref:Acetoin utilization protein AcuB n=1 Tax=Desulfacinum hydrothermale DSM 13146 TaxID=1121390 RepID=A0A1W1XSU2_9BACT|nr:CBS domain-containing protein [Desulfacinum hydrothermale]SMC26621.1 acetoin utilization protein AcuB [Desulfacinum hydrothermale DSM 13146]